MNPCPCGYYGADTEEHQCRCTPGQIQRYRDKISGPLLDRIDLQVEVPRMDIDSLFVRENAGRRSESADFASLVAEAQERQARRYVNENFRFNGELDAAGVRRYCPLDEPGENLLKQAFRTLNFSGRAYHRILKLALTLADLEGHDRIRAEHLAEALQYRALDKS